jgi:hypothetical protein
MDHKISILFYSKIASKTKDNLVPIYLRITIDGKRIAQTIKQFVELSKWSASSGRMKGTQSEARAFGGFLDTVNNKCMLLNGNCCRMAKKSLRDF